MPKKQKNICSHTLPGDRTPWLRKSMTTALNMSIHAFYVDLMYSTSGDSQSIALLLHSYSVGLTRAIDQPGFSSTLTVSAACWAPPLHIGTASGDSPGQPESKTCPDPKAQGFLAFLYQEPSSDLRTFQASHPHWDKCLQSQNTDQNPILCLGQWK